MHSESRALQAKFLKVVQQHPSLAFVASAEAYKAISIYYRSNYYKKKVGYLSLEVRQ